MNLKYVSLLSHRDVNEKETIAMSHLFRIVTQHKLEKAD